MKRNYRLVLVVLLIIGWILVGAGCGVRAPTPTAETPEVATPTPEVPTPTPEVPTPTPEKARRGDLVVAVEADIIGWDAMYGSSNTNQGLLQHVVEKLVERDDEGNFEGRLATDWEVSEDGRTWTFHLRQGVIFHDGLPFNADAVVATVERNTDAEVPRPRTSIWAPIESAVAVDEHTVQITTAEPYGPFLNLLSHASGGIQSPALGHVERITFPIGTGPYKLYQWLTGERTILLPNENYWGEPPRSNSITFVEAPEIETRIAMLQTGEAHYATQVPPQYVELVKSDPNLTLYSTSGTRTLWIEMNTKKAPFDNVLVRRAVGHAIDRQAIVDGIFMGTAPVSDSFLASTLTGHHGVEDYFAYDPDLARDLLAQAGYPDGFSTKLLYGVGRYLLQPEIMTVVQQQLSEVGIDVEIETVEWANWHASITQPLEETTLEMISWGWSSPTGDIQYVLDSNFLCTSRYNPNHFYCNPDLDALADLARQRTDPVERQGYLDEIQEIMAEDAMVIGLFVYPTCVGYSNRLHDALTFADEEFYFGNAWVEPE